MNLTRICSPRRRTEHRGFRLCYTRDLRSLIAPFGRPPTLPRFLALCWIALLPLTSLIAGDDDSKYQVDFWTTENGLPDNLIKAIRQTRDGYIWLTTESGLVRFDGLRFRLFSTGNTPQLKTNRYASFALMEDGSGALWAGTLRNGVVRYRDGLFRTYDTSNGLPNNKVSRIDEDERGAVWIYTEKGVAKFDHGTMKTVQIEKAHPGAASANRIGMGAVLGEDRIFCGEWLRDSTGLWRFAYGEWTRLPRIPGVTDVTRLRLDRLLEDTRGRLWFTVQGEASNHYSLDRDANLASYRDWHPDPGGLIRFEDSRGRRVPRGREAGAH